jgi:hypothetical protein
MSDAKVSANDLDEVILVGGSTRMAHRLAARSIMMLLILEGGKEGGKQVGALGPDPSRKWIESVVSS